MKINEVVILHPSVAAKSEYDMLWHAGEEEMDGIIEFIMDDRNPEVRRLAMLRHLDELMGETKDEYSAADLQSFMYDQDEPPEPPLRLVDNTQDEEIPTGEYEICASCDGEGCPECEEGLKDITGMHKIPDFSQYE